MSNQQDGSLQTTKQMLDELDALMERMLALPVNELDHAPPFPEEVVKTPALSATLTLLESPPPLSAPPLEAPPGPPPEHPVTNPPHMAFSVATTDLPALPGPPAELTNAVEPPSVMPQLEPLLAPIPEPVPPESDFGLLLWINQIFDGATTILGGIGTALRSQGGRALLGLSGLAMMAVAIGWFLKDWLGWNW